MVRYDSIYDIPIGCHKIFITLDNIPINDNLYPLLNEKIEVFNCTVMSAYNKESYFVNNDGLDKICKILNKDKKSIKGYFIPIEFVTNREEKLKRILDIC